jgi:hypothetical protein
MSILGDMVNEKKGIKENLDDNYFEFYVAGYTKQCEGVETQPNHALLYKGAISYAHMNNIALPMGQPDEYLFPFGKKNDVAKVLLIPEPNNPYDPNALKVKVVVNKIWASDIPNQELYLGYVPKLISRIVSHNLENLADGWIKKVRTVFKGNKYTTKVAFPWIIPPGGDDAMFMDRLAQIAREID